MEQKKKGILFKIMLPIVTLLSGGLEFGYET